MILHFSILGHLNGQDSIQYEWSKTGILIQVNVLQMSSSNVTISRLRSQHLKSLEITQDPAGHFQWHHPPIYLKIILMG